MARHLGRVERSVRRNRLIAEFFQRASFIGRIGSGFAHMERALLENYNPPLEVIATNLFNIQFYQKLPDIDLSQLIKRHTEFYRNLVNSNRFSK